MGWMYNWANYFQQRKHFQYQKDLQQEIFDREDTAQQRAVEDLRAAGLSPALAAGKGAGAGAIVKTNPPQFESTAGGINKVMQALTMGAQISKTLEESLFINAQKNRVNQLTAFESQMQPLLLDEKKLSNLFNDKTFRNRVNTVLYDAKSARSQARKLSREYELLNIEYWREKDFDSFLYKQVKDATGVRPTPQQVEYLRQYLIVNRDMWNLKYYQTAYMPTDASVKMDPVTRMGTQITGATKALLSPIMKLIGDEKAIKLLERLLK